MAISNTIQTLSAAFSLGILLQAAITALLLYLKGHETKLLQDHKRLVLVVFLLSAALWAQSDFISFLLPTSSTTGCQALVSVSSIFDQSARVAVGAYLLFSIGNTAGKYIFGGLVVVVVARAAIGIVFGALARPQFAPLCIAKTSSMAVSALPIALDTLIIGVLAIRTIQLGTRKNERIQEKQDQSKALTVVTIGFTVWTATSVPLELGLPNIIFLVRTVVPATGLTILVLMVTAFTSILVTSLGEDDVVSEAQSPFRPEPPRRTLGTNYSSSSDRIGSPVTQAGYGKRGRLFVTNPSDTPRDFTPSGQDKGRDLQVKGVNAMDLGESSGAVGSIALGAASSITAVPAPTAQQKRSLFNRSKTEPRPNVRALGISNPIVDEAATNNPETPFARMQTIDLATARENERVRREEAAALWIRTDLQNPRSAPLPPIEEGLRKSTSTKRKGVSKSTRQPMPSTTSSSSIISSHISTNGAVASSVSRSLSPNPEDVRRRSPRFLTLEEKQTYPPRPQQLQKKLGLPNGPRPIISRPISQALTPTVMFVNNIIYDNPNQVKSRLSFTESSPGAPIRHTKDLERDFRDSETIPLEALTKFDGDALSSLKTPDTSFSIMNRPRPYRKERDSRGIFPSDISGEVGHHRRSKSAGSLTTMISKSIFEPYPGNPANLPALPPAPRPTIQLPKSAAALPKLLPKSTAGMTADEKISILFPAPPGNQTLPQRRSSVPSIPSTFTVSLKSISQEPKPKETKELIHQENPRETFRFSADSYQKFAGVNEQELPASQYKRGSTFSYLAGEIRTGSTPATRPVSRKPEPSTHSSFNLGSPVVNVPPPVPILRKPLASEYEDVVPVSPTEIDDDEEISERDESRASSHENSQGSYLLEDEDSEDEEEIETPIDMESEQASFRSASWHRRIGDELPTFSDRGSLSRPRAVPPPPPLVLNQSRRNQKFLVREVEPEIDSPSRAIAEIQAQLRKFEETDRQFVGAMLKRFPSDASLKQPQMSDNDASKELLDNLEKEMGLQENAWMKMQHNFDRDSNSSLLTPRNQSTLSRVTSARSSTISNDTVSRMRRDLAAMENQNLELMRDRATLWQQRLELAHAEFMEGGLKNKRVISLLSIQSDVRQPKISLQPEVSEPESQMTTVPEVSPPKTLWQPSDYVPERTTSLWAAPMIFERPASPKIPGLSLRPNQRRDMTTLSHNSSTMWMKPANSGFSATRPIAGLWGSRTARPKSIQTRPVTQRPPRKSKRITFLPDIIESPSPLQNKRDTLGIYKFPWGNSDSAIYRPASNTLLSMPQPVFKPNAETMERQMQMDEYSSSFVDDYEDGTGYEENSEEDQSDDDFDESTLWEIASLLKTKEGVPSKNSLLPPANGIFDDYEEEEMEEFEDDSQYIEDSVRFEPIARLSPRKSFLWAGKEANIESKVAGLAQPPTPVWESYNAATDIVRPKSKLQLPLESLASRQLWASTDSQIPERHTFCLWNPQPTEPNEEAPAVAPREIPVVVEESSEAPATFAKDIPVAAEKISAPKAVAPIPQEVVVKYAPLPSTVFVQPATWKRSKKPEQEPETDGLFKVDNTRSAYRTTQLSPVAKDIRVQRTSRNLNVPALESSDLWTPNTKERHVSWIEKTSTPLVVTSIPIFIPVVVAQPSMQQSVGMWSAPVKVEKTSATGLFSLENTVSRTSTEDPVARQMVSRPRRVQNDVQIPQLYSRRLWRSDDCVILERDWISESSVRPLSPSICSTPSEASSPEIESDCSSIYSTASTSTKASSIWSAISGTPASLVSVSNWVPSKRKPALLPSMPENDDESEGQDSSNPPSRQSSLKLPGPSSRREPRVLANAAMIESRTQNEQDATRFAGVNRGVSKFTPPPRKQIDVPLRQQFRPIFVANWDAALREAIDAGSPKQVQIAEAKPAKRRFVRRKISAAEWDDALNEAIAKSQPCLERPKASAAMWRAALSEATGNATKLTTRTHMWSPVFPKHTVAQSSPMWQVPASLPSPKPTLFDAVKAETLRNAKPSRIASLEKLTSNSTWRKDERTKLVAKRWLEGSKARAAERKSAEISLPASVVEEPSKPAASYTPQRPALTRTLTWTAPQPTTASPNSTPMWSQPQTPSDKRESIFTSLPTQPIRKTSPKPHSLPKLKTQELFTPENRRSYADIHWLYVSSKTLHTPITAEPRSFNLGFNNQNAGLSLNTIVEPMIEPVSSIAGEGEGDYIVTAETETEANTPHSFDLSGSLGETVDFDAYERRSELFSEYVDKARFSNVEVQDQEEVDEKIGEGEEKNSVDVNNAVDSLVEKASFVAKARPTWFKPSF